MTYTKQNSINVLFPKLDGTNKTLNSVISNIWSAGVISGGVVTDKGDGTVSISSGEAVLREASTPTSNIVHFNFNANTNVTLTNNTTNYVILDYNNGTPVISVVLNTNDFDCLSKCIICTVTKEDNFLNIVHASYQNVDANRKHRRLLLEVEPFRKVTSGGALGSNNLNLTLSASAYYYGLNKISFSSFDTSVAGNNNQNIFYYYYKDASNNWVRVDNSKSIDNLRYNNSTGLTSLGSNKYKVDWIYLVNNNISRLAVVYGRNEYTSQAGASLEPSPSDLPASIKGVGVLLGRVIVKESLNNLVVENIVNAGFQGVSLSSHNELSDIQGGSLSEYYHLNSSDYTNVTNLNASLSGKQDVLQSGVNINTIDNKSLLQGSNIDLTRTAIMMSLICS